MRQEETTMLTSLKRNIKRASRSLGYDIVPLREAKDRDFALHLGQLFSVLEVDCVFDIGANQGQYRDFLREQVLYQGLIVSFEPVSHNIAVLQERSHDDANWLIQPYALGSQAGELQINVMKSDQFSSFLQPDNRHVPQFDGLNEPSHVETVKMRRFDEVSAELRRRLHYSNFYLKLDTQGYDLNVVEGAGQELERCCALQTEASVIGIYRGMPTYVDTIRYLNGRDFDITGLYPISRDAGLRLIEFDCVMINRSMAA
jgi:FkbM family methyltransferase